MEDRRSLTQSELVDALAAHEDAPFRRETLEAMDDEELAAAANSTGVPFEELAQAANRRSERSGRGGGDGLGFEAGGILRDTPSSADGEARNAGGGGGLPPRRRTGEDLDLDVPAGNVLSGPRGESVLDGDGGLSSGDDEPEDLGFSPGSILGGFRGESVLDD